MPLQNGARVRESGSFEQGGAMTGNRRNLSAAAIGGLLAAILLPTGSSNARADELADLRANQELLQQRIEQISQGAVPGQYVPGFGPETQKKPSGTPVTGGSFPRSFLIPAPTPRCASAASPTPAPFGTSMVRPRPASSMAKAATSIRPLRRGRAAPGIWAASRSTTRLG